MPLVASSLVARPGTRWLSRRRSHLLCQVRMRVVTGLASLSLEWDHRNINSTHPTTYDLLGITYWSWGSQSTSYLVSSSGGPAEALSSVPTTVAENPTEAFQGCFRNRLSVIHHHHQPPATHHLPPPTTRRPPPTTHPPTIHLENVSPWAWRGEGAFFTSPESASRTTCTAPRTTETFTPSNFDQAVVACTI